jgi:hypothetical protein
MCDPAKIIFTSKLKLGQHIDGKLLIANHLDELLWWANQKHWAAVRSYWGAESVSVPFTSHCKVCNYAEPKPFFWAKQAHFDFSSSNFLEPNLAIYLHMDDCHFGYITKLENHCFSQFYPTLITLLMIVWWIG